MSDFWPKASLLVSKLAYLGPTNTESWRELRDRPSLRQFAVFVFDSFLKAVKYKTLYLYQLKKALWFLVSTFVSQWKLNGFLQNGDFEDIWTSNASNESK